MSDEMHIAPIDGSGLGRIGPQTPQRRQPPAMDRRAREEYEANETGGLTPQQIEDGAEALAQLITVLDEDVEAVSGRENSRTVMRLMMRATGETVRTIPQEALGVILARLRSTIGLTLNQNG